MKPITDLDRSGAAPQRSAAQRRSSFDVLPVLEQLKRLTHSVGALCYFVELQASHSIFKSLSSVAVRRTRRKILTHFKSFRRTLSHVSLVSDHLDQIGSGPKSWGQPVV